MTDIVRTGHCLCGAVRFETRGQPKFISNCHCESCRRAASAPSMPWAGFRDDQVRIEGEKLARHASSPGVFRSFCGQCGSQIAYQGDRWPGETHLAVCAFDNAAALAPTSDYFEAEKLPWAKLLGASGSD